jgi:hypothetical protein
MYNTLQQFQNKKPNVDYFLFQKELCQMVQAQGEE